MFGVLHDALVISEALLVALDGVWDASLFCLNVVHFSLSR